MGFSWQEYGSVLPGNLPNPGIGTRVSCIGRWIFFIIVPPGKLMFKYPLKSLFSLCLYIYPELEWLDHMLILFLSFWGTTRQLSTAGAPSSNVYKGSNSLHLQVFNNMVFFFLSKIIVMQMGVKCGVLFFYPFILILYSISSLFSNTDLPLSLCFIISSHYPLGYAWQTGGCFIPRNTLSRSPIACWSHSPRLAPLFTQEQWHLTCPLPATPLSCPAGCLPSRASSSPSLTLHTLSKLLH